MSHEPPDGHPTATLAERVRSLALGTIVRPRQKRRSSWLPWLLCLVLSGHWALRTFHQAPAHRADERPSTAEDRGVPATSAPPTSASEIVLECKGYVVPVHQIQVSPKVSGMIVWLHERFAEGSRFQEGEVLARLEDVDYKARRDYAQHFLDAAQRRLQELERNWPEEIAQLKAKRDEAEEVQRQAERDLKRGVEAGFSATRNEVEKLRSSLDTARFRFQDAKIALELMEKGPRKDKIEAAQAEVRQAKANLEEAQWRLDNCAIRAPISGTMLTKKAEKGNIVNPVAFNIAASLCDMADLADLEGDLNIQERDVAKVRKGQRCQIRPEAFPDRVYDGVVSRLMPIADRAKGAIPVRVKVVVPRQEEEGMYLKPEMGILVSFLK
jgi:multidrug resistance efflux pump